MSETLYAAAGREIERLEELRDAMNAEAEAIERETIAGFFAPPIDGNFPAHVRRNMQATADLVGEHLSDRLGDLLYNLPLVQMLQAMATMPPDALQALLRNLIRTKAAEQAGEAVERDAKRPFKFN